MKTQKPEIASLFNSLLAAAQARNLLGMANFNRAAFLKRAKRALAHNLSEPGDCAGDLPLLIGLSLAQAEIGQGAGWIPVVQKLGCEIAALAKDVQPVYRKNSIEAKLDSLLPVFPSYDVIAHELWSDCDEYSFSVNDSWHLAKRCDREEAIGHLVNRWHVFKANYAPKARVRDLTDANYSGDEFPALLEVDCIPFAEVRNGGEE